MKIAPRKGIATTKNVTERGAFEIGYGNVRRLHAGVKHRRFTNREELHAQVTESTEAAAS